MQCVLDVGNENVNICGNLTLEPDEYVCRCFISQIASHLLVFYLCDNLVGYTCAVRTFNTFGLLKFFFHVQAKAAKIRMGGQ